MEKKKKLKKINTSDSRKNNAIPLGCNCQCVCFHDNKADMASTGYGNQAKVEK